MRLFYYDSVDLYLKAPVTQLMLGDGFKYIVNKKIYFA